MSLAMSEVIFDLDGNISVQLDGEGITLGRGKSLNFGVDSFSEDILFSLDSTITRGSILYGRTNDILTVLAPNITPTRKYLSQIGDGSGVLTTSWEAVTAGGGGSVTSVTGVLNRLSIGGTPSDPIVDIASTYIGQTSITTLGTIATGTWNATALLASKVPNLENLNGLLTIGKGGTGQVTANAALNALLPSQGSQSGKFLTTDGSNSSWGAVSAIAIGSSIGSSTVGSLLFVGAGNVLQEDNAHLFWDNAADTLTVTERLDVRSAAANGTLSLTNTSAGGNQWLLFFSGTGSGFDGGFRLWDGGASKPRIAVTSEGLIGFNTTPGGYTVLITPADGATKSSVGLESHVGGVNQSWFFGSGTDTANGFRIVDITGGTDAVYVQPGTLKTAIASTSPLGQFHIAIRDATYDGIHMLLANGQTADAIRIREGAGFADVFKINCNGHVSQAIGSTTSLMTGIGVTNIQTSAAGIGNAADTTDDTLFTYTLPLNAMSSNGKSLRSLATGHFATNANTKQVKFWFAGTAIADSGALTLSNTDWTCEIEVSRIDSTHVSCKGVFTGSNVASVITITPNLAVSSLVTNNSIIKITGASTIVGAANDVVGYMMKTWFEN